MKLSTGWVLAAGLAFVTSGVHAQVERAPSTVVSDVGGPSAAAPKDGPRAGGPMLLPPMEVYTVVRESGLSPLGIPQRRGLIYSIAVVDRGGGDGRLIIDARSGRVIRFLPAYGMGRIFNDDLAYGPPGMPPMTNARGAPRPPRSVPNVASRTVPLPKASPLAAKPEAEPQVQHSAAQQSVVQQSAAVQPKPAEAQVTQEAAAATVGQAKPPPAPLQPTQEMPQAQGLE
jgi:hypothetical protein